MSPLYYLRLFSVSGVDAGDFLHGQLSADIVSLKPGDATLAAYCSPRGQVIATVLVQRRETDWLLALERGLSDETVQRMSRFVLRARVKFSALEGVWLAGSITDATGPGSGQGLWLGEVGLGYTLTSQFPADAGSEALAWKQLELRHGLCWLSAETSERFLPQMLGLEDIGALSFSKGCYPGQEIIARARYLGKVKRTSALLELEGNAALHAGGDCSLSGPDGAVEGSVLDSVCADGELTTVMVVAAIGDDHPGSKPQMKVDTFIAGGSRWPARRMARKTGRVSG